MVLLQEIAALVHQRKLASGGELEGFARALVAVDEVQVLLHVVDVACVRAVRVQVRRVEIVEPELRPHMNVREWKLVDDLLQPSRVVGVLVDEHPRHARYEIIDVHHAQDLESMKTGSQNVTKQLYKFSFF